MKVSELRERSLAALWWLLFGGASAWLLAGSVAYWVRNGWLPADVSGWVQAFGSIGAILAAIWISYRQDQSNKRDRQRREYHYMFKAFNMSAFADQAAQALAGAVAADPNDRGVIILYKMRLKDAYDEVARFAYPTFADQEFADIWLSGKRGYGLLLEQIEIVLKLEEPAGYAVSLKNVADACSNSVKKLKVALDQHSQRVGVAVWEEHHP